ILKSLEIKTAGFAYVKSMKELETCPNIPKFPLIVKPVTLGSSIGVEKAENEEELKSAVECGLLYDGAVILEEYLQNRREINCAAYYYDGEVITSECEEAITKSDVLSFEDKYTGGGKSVLPADLPVDISGAIKQITQKVYKNLNMRGIVRFDFILSGGEIYLSEVNTVPGSLSYYLLSGGFKDFYRVLSQVIKQAQTDFNAVQSKKLIKTGILANVPSNACKLPHK
ncbi:MAG: ATP-grasp domain-containing protein, partial [Clostridia bacterium]|nr:ATP-grasp domain-containing protein [Clostridia bacterium]